MNPIALWANIFSNPSVCCYVFHLYSWHMLQIKLGWPLSGDAKGRGQEEDSSARIQYEKYSTTVAETSLKSAIIHLCTKGIFKHKVMQRFEEITPRKEDTAHTAQLLILIESAFSKKTSANLFMLVILVFMAKLLYFLKSVVLQLEALLCPALSLLKISHHLTCSLSHTTAWSK